ncbi:MAG TPA: efflux RND transporter periplasmic adaptor subunit [Anaerolineales bacterium]|nr:efflux RND transporter periplasmic adaptor subunit [Anaerolineales bacterium]
MNKTAVIIFVLVGILVVGASGYYGFATTQEPEPTPTPPTVSVTSCDVEQTVTAPGNLIIVTEVDVKMPVMGRLSAVNVRVGDQVMDGQTLAELDPVATTQAQLDLLEAQTELETLEKRRTSLDYPRATDDFIKDLRKQVNLAKQVVAELENAYKKAEDPLVKSQALVSVNAAKDDLKNLQSRLDWYTSNPTEGDITTADSELALAQAKYDAAKAVLESLQIKAPFDGVVFEVSAQVGETYQAEVPLFVIGDPKALEVIANVTEEDYPLLAIGQAVEVYFDARPDVTVQGKVDRIIPKRIEGDRPLYNIYISLNDVPEGLADGMTSDTAITIAKHAGVLCLPRAVVRASGGSTTTVKVWDGMQQTTKEITIGLRGDTYVEIVSGLDEGEQVVTR